MLICNKKAHFFVLGLICFLKLMDVGYRHMPIKLTRIHYPKTLKMNFIYIKVTNFPFSAYYKIFLEDK
ncbi:hypothetical protein COJ31_14560 [Bacillus cereus]|nr:hypothetical protein COJ31_14560 [Bacillus cereus]